LFMNLLNFFVSFCSELLVHYSFIGYVVIQHLIVCVGSITVKFHLENSALYYMYYRQLIMTLQLSRAMCQSN